MMDLTDEHILALYVEDTNKKLQQAVILLTKVLDYEEFLDNDLVVSIDDLLTRTK